MKAISHFLRITVLGGVLFLTPIVALVFILGKAFDLRTSRIEAGGHDHSR